MRLSELIPHTSTWVGVPESHVNTVARALRPAGLLSSAGKGPKAAAMTIDDKINLFIGTCCVEVANRAAEHVRIWSRLTRYGDKKDQCFAFLQAATVKDFFFDLITKDLNGGPLDTWLKEAHDPFDRNQNTATVRHNITLDFYVDQFMFTIVVSRFVSRIFQTPEQSSANTIEVTFGQRPPGGEHEYVYGLRDQGYSAGSKLIRRLDERNLRGWGTCLLHDGARDER